MGIVVFVRRGLKKLSRVKDYIKDRGMYFSLNDSGFVPLKKVMRRFMLGKRQLVAFYGECHIYIYGGILTHMSDAKKKYFFLGSKEIEYLIRYHEKYIGQKSSWDKLDVIIYNPGVPTRKGAPALEEVLGWIPASCRKIEVTNAVFKGYMPQHTEKVFKNAGYFVWGDKNLNKLLAEHQRDDAALENLKRTDYYTPEFVNSYFDKSVKHLRLYEQQCTVRIADYIERYGRERVLYYSVTHPETEVMNEITKRILKALDIATGELPHATDDLFELHSHGEVVYPSVYFGLGIAQDWTERLIQPGNYKEQIYAFCEYLAEYMKQGKESAASE